MCRRWCRPSDGLARSSSRSAVGDGLRVTARHLVVGLDGADWDLVEAIGRARLPTLFSLRDRGAYARLLSVLPFATLPNWTTFLTGMDPGTHGVFDFTTRDGYRVHFASGSAS